MDKPRYIGGRVKGIHLAVVAFVLSLALLLAVGGITVYVLTHKTQTNARNAEEIRRAAVESCEVNGNPLRVVVQGLLREQVRNAESPVIQNLFPQIPPSLLRAHIAADERRLAEIAPIDCSKQYPKP